MRLIAITGGIGSGKSVVAHMVQVMGYQVYDCDSRAKSLMVHDPDVRQLLVQTFGPETYLSDGSINRQHLSAVAFADEHALARLNGIVHPATERDIQRWADEQAATGAKLAFVETALLRTAGLDKLVDGVWHVTAPAEVRVRRVMTRSGLTDAQVRERMAAQSVEETIAHGECAIINDGNTAVMPQISALLSKVNVTKQ
ncbi:MAG: dephospho-CoA kinase [Muribaculaceae bacterium]|nr:dephospho-CoA kinase [Muribaculaceae bacterium]